MKYLTIYIVFHNKGSFDLFQENNPELIGQYEFIIVGNYNGESLEPKNSPCWIHKSKMYDNNIEQYPSLLSFTAWYLIAKNNLCKTEFVGIFEYDVKFSPINYIKLSADTIYGINRRNLPDSMFLEVLPELKELIHFDESKISYWNCTSNFIMPMKFLKGFVDWYMTFIPGILKIDKHSHFHERAINIYAANNGYKNETIEGIEHLELNSHGIRL
jgi:hypothetical protein